MSRVLTVRRHGDPDSARHVLVLHGFGTSGDEQFPAAGLPLLLAERGAHVIVPDLLGHGRSPDGRAVIPLDDQVEALTALLEQADGAVRGLLGYSMGARIALDLLAAPAVGSLERVVLAGLPASEPFLRVDLDALAEGSTPLTALVRAREARGENPVGAIRGLVARPYDIDDVRTDAAVLAVAGSDDPLAAPERLAEHLPHARAVRLPGTHGSLPSSRAFQQTVAEHLIG